MEERERERAREGKGREGYIPSSSFLLSPRGFLISFPFVFTCVSYLPLLGVGLFFVIVAVAVAVQLSSAGLVSRVSVAVGSRVAGRGSG